MFKKRLNLSSETNYSPWIINVFVELVVISEESRRTGKELHDGKQTKVIVIFKKSFWKWQAWYQSSADFKIKFNEEGDIRAPLGIPGSEVMRGALFSGRERPFKTPENVRGRQHSRHHLPPTAGTTDLIFRSPDCYRKIRHISQTENDSRHYS